MERRQNVYGGALQAHASPEINSTPVRDLGVYPETDGDQPGCVVYDSKAKRARDSVGTSCLREVHCRKAA